MTARLAAAAPGAPTLWDEAPLERVRRCRRRRSTRGRRPRSRAPRTSCASRRGSTASPACRWSRAPRSGDWDAASGRYTVHAGAGGPGDAQRESPACSACPRRRARGGARRRRQLRHAQQLLSRVRAGGVGGAPRRPAGEVDVRAPRGVPRPTTRAAISSSTRRAGARRRGHVLAMRGVNTSNVGAHAVSFVPLNKGVAIMSSVYRMPAVASTGAPCSATRRRPRPIAAPAGRRSCSSWSG